MAKEKKVKKSSNEHENVIDEERNSLVETSVKIPGDDKEIEKTLTKKEDKDTVKVFQNRSRWMKKYFKKVLGHAKKQYDEFIKTDYENVVERATMISGIKKTDYDKLVLITVPDAFKTTRDIKYRFDHKEDDSFTLKYDQALATVLFFGDESLFYYKVNIDHISGDMNSDIAGEFNFFDVVHMETSLKYDDGDKPTHIMLDLNITLSNGVVIVFNLRNHHLHASYKLSSLITKTENEILNAIKGRIRASRIE